MVWPSGLITVSGEWGKDRGLKVTIVDPEGLHGRVAGFDAAVESKDGSRLPGVVLGVEDQHRCLHKSDHL